MRYILTTMVMGLDGESLVPDLPSTTQMVVADGLITGGLGSEVIAVVPVDTDTTGYTVVSSSALQSEISRINGVNSV